MEDRQMLRIGSVSAVLGAILLVVTNILHPRDFEYGDTASHFADVAGSDIYLGDHIGLLVGALLMTAGLIAIARSLREGGGAAWAFFGLTSAVVSAGLMVVVIGIDGIAFVAAADELSGMSTAAFLLEQIGLGLFTMLIFFTFGVMYALYGLAISLSDTYPKYMGWIALVGGIAGMTIGIVQAYEGPSDTLTNVLFPIVSVLLTVWVFAMGLFMWKKASAA